MPTPTIDEHGKESAHCFQIGGESDDPRAHKRSQAPEIQVAPSFRERAPQRRSEPAPIQSSTAPQTTAQLIRALRERLRVVEREIKLRAKLDIERAQIKRLISAAQLERDNVRRIRSAG